MESDIVLGWKLYVIRKLVSKFSITKPPCCLMEIDKLSLKCMLNAKRSLLQKPKYVPMDERKSKIFTPVKKVFGV